MDRAQAKRGVGWLGKLGFLSPHAHTNIPCQEGAKGAGVLSGPARKMNPCGMPPGLEPTIYGAGDMCISGMLLPDVVVYPHL